MNKEQKMKKFFIFKKCNIFLNDVLKNRENCSFKESLNNSEFNIENSIIGSDTFLSPDNFESEPGIINFDNLFHNDLESIMNDPNHLNFIFNKESKELEQYKKEFDEKTIIPIEYQNTSKRSLNQMKTGNDQNSKFRTKFRFLKINQNDNTKKLLGRKKKGDKDEREHTKFSDDNKMRKIKTYFNHFIHNYVNSSLSPGHKKLLKINTNTNEKLKKELNVNLMKMKLKDIFTQYSVNRKSIKCKNGNKYNSEIIEDIYKNKIEKTAIERLNLSYIEVLDIMRGYYLDEFKKDIFDKEIRNGENEERAKEYVKDLVDLLFEFETWFNNKASRNPKKINKF